MSVVIPMLKGFVIGAANVIPGVSGGTMALLMGIYDRTVSAVSSVGPALPRDLLDSARTAEGRRHFLVKYDVVFLGSLGLGAVLAIMSLARLLKWSLNEAHDPTYGFFFGLVALSVWAPLRQVQKWGGLSPLFFAAGMLAVFALATWQKPAERVQYAVERAAAKEPGAVVSVSYPDGRSAEGVLTQALPGQPFMVDGLSEPLVFESPSALAPADSQRENSAGGGQALAMFLSGAVAISAMVLPGISGSFVLLLLGMYFPLLDAIASFDIWILAAFGLGCMVGLSFFSKILKFLLNRAHDVTMFFLSGLVAGSLYAIWPFQGFVVVGAQRVDLGPLVVSGSSGNVALTGALALAGAALVLMFYRLDRETGRDQTSL